MTTRIWNLTKAFPGKVNFIDDNNVILGYDLESSCCENAFWTISESPDGSNPIHEGDGEAEKEIELDGYNFDPEFCEQVDNEVKERYSATFKLVSRSWGEPKLPDLFLRLENHHNGYYSHGFTFRSAVVIKSSL
tara:strand:- start:8918 stop:9319 length:402 start_codon:yes stop_codon:yes gene_type:complete